MFNIFPFSVHILFFFHLHTMRLLLANTHTGARSGTPSHVRVATRGHSCVGSFHLHSSRSGSASRQLQLIHSRLCTALNRFACHTFLIFKEKSFSQNKNNFHSRDKNYMKKLPVQEIIAETKQKFWRKAKEFEIPVRRQAKNLVVRVLES